MRRSRGLLLSVALVLGLLTAGAGPQPSQSAGYRPPASPCGKHKKPRRHYRHVIWIVFENKNAGQIYGNPSGATPYMNALAHQCGRALNMHAEYHPSAPNYVAMTSGGSQRVRGDPNPRHALRANNIFYQVYRSGRRWVQYSSREPDAAQGGGDCFLRYYPPPPRSFYVPHHEPAPYYADIYWNRRHRDCRHWDVPLDAGNTGPLCESRSPSGCADTRSGALAKALAHNTLPAFTFISPADDGGNGRLGGEVDPRVGDRFLQRWMVKIMRSAAYRSGETAIFITWDENARFGGSPTNPTIPTILVAPSIRPHSTSRVWFNHYSILRTTEQMLGIHKYLGGAAHAKSMRSAFRW